MGINNNSNSVKNRNKSNELNNIINILSIINNRDFRFESVVSPINIGINIVVTNIKLVLTPSTPSSQPTPSISWSLNWNSVLLLLIVNNKYNEIYIVIILPPKFIIGFDGNMRATARVNIGRLINSFNTFFAPPLTPPPKGGWDKVWKPYGLGFGPTSFRRWHALHVGICYANNMQNPKG